jgi:Ca2+-binding RTX toxin-like protein
VTLASGQVIVPTGVTSFTVTVPTTDDAIDEPIQTFVLSVGGVAGTGNITDNDLDTGTPEVNTVPVGQSTAEDVALVFSTANNNPITVANDVTATTISIASGTLTASTSTSAGIADNGSGSVTITGTTAEINGALDGLIYAGTADYNGSVILTVTSTGGAETIGSVAINMTPVVDITDDSVAFTPTSTGFCDSVPATDTPIVDGQAALSTASNTYTVGSASTDTVIHGLGGNDTITTTSTGASNNSIVTLEGNDTITTTTVDGTNVICAGDGNNIITTTITGTGGNFVQMDKGNDTLTTTNVNGDNTILAGDGNNTLTTTTTGSGNTKVVAGTGNDTITTTNVGGGSSTILSGAGNDTVSTGAGADLVVSGAGNDTVTTTGGADIILSGSGNDTVTSGEGNDIVLSAAGNDTIAAGAGDDIIISGSGNDRINAAAGADIIDSGAGNDIIRLGTGDGVEDVVIFGSTATANGNDAITQFTSGTDKLNLDAMTTQTATTEVTGSLTVTAGSVYFLSTTVATAASTAALSATALDGGATWANASNGTVAFFIVSAPNGSAIYQYVEAGTAGINVAELTLMGTIDATITTSDLVFEANAAAVNGLAAGLAGLASTQDAPSASSLTIDVLANDTFDNTVKTITAVNGNAITQGGAAVAVDNGSVTLVDAELVFTPTLVTYNGIATFSYTVTSGGVSETANVNVQVGPVVDPPVEGALRTDSITLVMGTEAAETLPGTTGDDIIVGVNGADTFNGDAGNDIFIGGLVGADTMTGDDGDDIMWGRSGADTMTGGAGNDTMYGGVGADPISGGAGNDFLDGGLGADLLSGEAGDDAIVFDVADETTVDGGIGEDTLIFSSATTISFATLAAVPVNFEIIDLTINGVHTLNSVTAAGVIALTDSDNALTILKDAADTVDLDGTWGTATNTTETVNGVSSSVESYTNTVDTSVTLKIITTSESTNAAYNAQDITLLPFTGGAGNDLITGTTGIDTLTGGAGDDIMFGGTGVDILNGDAGNDILLGGTGADILNGGIGSDVMFGDTGGDTFKWNLSDIGNDFINDFSRGAAATDDKLDLSDLLVGESSDAASLDDYLNFSASPGGGTLITVDTNGAAAGGEGQTITLENITYASWATYTGATDSDSDIITKMLSDASLIVG